jgi:UPF0716 protein FxsA
MALLLFLLFIGVPILEIYVASLVVEQLGFGLSSLLLLIATVLGIVVIRAAWRRRPRGADNALLLVAGLLLLFPGYVTDVLGLLLLLPPVRAVLKVWIGQRVDHTLRSWNLTVLRWDDRTGRLTRNEQEQGYGGGDIVTGEVVDEGDPSDGPEDPPRPELR